MSFRTLLELFNALPTYLRALVVVIAVGLLLFLLTQREIVSNAIHLLRALPVVLILPGDHHQPPKRKRGRL